MRIYHCVVITVAALGCGGPPEQATSIVAPSLEDVAKPDTASNVQTMADHMRKPGRTPITCGQQLAAGRYRLDSDLACDGLGLHLRDGAHVDLNGHTITCSGAGLKVGLLVDGSFPEIRNGRIVGCNLGIWVFPGDHVRIVDVTILGTYPAEYAEGIRLQGTSYAHVVDCNIRRTTGAVFLQPDRNQPGDAGRAHDNVLRRIEAKHNFGGVEMLDSDYSTVADGDISRNRAFGILLSGSDHNSILDNLVENTSDGTNGGTGIAVVDGSSHNRIEGNSASSPDENARAVDGINVGCREYCQFGTFAAPPSTGVNDNVVRDNIADDNARFGIALAPADNIDNRFRHNQACGNGEANFALDP